VTAASGPDGNAGGRTGSVCPVRMGVLDIGSNTVHLLLVDAHYGAAPIPASKLKMALRLAEHLTPEGNVDEEAIGLLIDFIRKGQQLSEDMGATEVMAFATSAIRDATNGEIVLNRVQEETGLTLEVLSGADEARMTFLAVRRWFGWSTGRLLVMDIGGGSLELASGLDEEPDVAISLPLGAGRLTRTHLDLDPPTPESIRELRRYARAQIADVAGRIRRVGEPRIAAGSSKTFKQLARIAGAPPSSEGMYVRRKLTLAALRTTVNTLSTMTASERAVIPGVSEGRSEQLIAGAIVAEAAMELLEINELAICPWALREGVILHRMDGLPA
jgi:exopolyphosphatase/guanosine-5'-triphosphate,3'-diphosphate pyrophosphatase